MHHVYIILRLHSIQALANQGKRSIAKMETYDETGAVDLHLPLDADSGFTIEDCVPYQSVITIERGACLRCPSTGKLYISVPPRMRHSKVFLFNLQPEMDPTEEAVAKFCEQIPRARVEEMV